MKMRISPWVYAAVLLLAGAYSFVILPRFHAFYQDLYEDVTLPHLTRFVLGVSPWGSFVFACTLVVLAILRNVLGRPRLLPRWAALVILLATVILAFAALFIPLVGTIISMGAK
jgi:type II secretory pathway component PulF